MNKTKVTDHKLVDLLTHLENVYGIKLFNSKDSCRLNKAGMKLVRTIEKELDIKDVKGKPNE